MKNIGSKFDNPKLKQVFNLESLPKITLEINVDDWNNLLEAFDADPGKNFWVPGEFVFEGGIEIPDQRLKNVGMRVRGNSSRNRPEGNWGQPHNPVNPLWRQASFAMQFERNISGQRFESLSRMDLKFIREDPTRIRELYSFDLYQQAGMYSGPLMSFCRLYITVLDGYNKPAYFGIYKMKEFIEDDYLEARTSYFNDDEPGSFIPFLWKGDYGAALNDWNATVIENRDIYDLRTNTKQREIANAQLTAFVKNLVTLEGDELKDWANEAMDVKLLMKTYMANVILGNMDDYWVGENNYNFYFNTHGKFFFIPNDFDTSLGTGWGFDAARQDVFYWGNPANPLIQRLLTIPEFKQQYIDSFYELTNAETGPFYVTRSIERIKQWQNLIKEYVWDDTFHFACQYEAGCILVTGDENYQTPFEDKTAWWASGGNNPDYVLLTEGKDNFFQVSGDPERLKNTRK